MDCTNQEPFYLEQNSNIIMGHINKPLDNSTNFDN